MNNVNCNIIKDILPLYVDEVVSADTRSMVSAHLENCADCRRKYEKLKSSISIPMDDNEAPLKKMKRTWNRKKVILVCSTLILAIAIMCLGLFLVEELIYQEEIA